MKKLIYLVAVLLLTSCGVFRVVPTPYSDDEDIYYYENGRYYNYNDYYPYLYGYGDVYYRYIYPPKHHQYIYRPEPHKSPVKPPKNDQKKEIKHRPSKYNYGTHRRR